MPLPVEETRRRIAARTHRCDPGCKGWEVFEVNREPELEIEACDDCWHDVPDGERVFDDDVAALPEAQAALRAEFLAAEAWEAHTPRGCALVSVLRDGSPIAQVRAEYAPLVVAAPRMFSLLQYLNRRMHSEEIADHFDRDKLVELDDLIRQLSGLPALPKDDGGP